MVKNTSPNQEVEVKATLPLVAPVSPAAVPPTPELTASEIKTVIEHITSGIAGQLALANDYGAIAERLRPTIPVAANANQTLFRIAGVVDGLIISVAAGIFPADDAGQKDAETMIAGMRRAWLKSQRYVKPETVETVHELTMQDALAIRALRDSITGRGGKFTNKAKSSLLRQVKSYFDGSLTNSEIDAACIAVKLSDVPTVPVA